MNLRFEELMMSWVRAGHVMSVLHECALIPPGPEPEPERWDSDCLSELLQGESAHLDPAKPADNLRKERKDYAFRRQFNEKPSITPGCPGKRPQAACLKLCFMAQITSGSLGCGQLVNSARPVHVGLCMYRRVHRVTCYCTCCLLLAPGCRRMQSWGLKSVQ